MADKQARTDGEIMDWAMKVSRKIWERLSCIVSDGANRQQIADTIVEEARPFIAENAALKEEVKQLKGIVQRFVDCPYKHIRSWQYTTEGQWVCSLITDAEAVLEKIKEGEKEKEKKQ